MTKMQLTELFYAVCSVVTYSNNDIKVQDQIKPRHRGNCQRQMTKSFFHKNKLQKK